jgi:hypothetical protein
MHTTTSRVRPVKELGRQTLTSQQIEELCSIAEETARKHVLFKVPSKNVETLNISAEAEGSKLVTLKIDVDLALSPSMKDINVQELTDEAVKKAFTSAGKYLRELTCHSQK